MQRPFVRLPTISEKQEILKRKNFILDHSSIVHINLYKKLFKNLREKHSTEKNREEKELSKIWLYFFNRFFYNVVLTFFLWEKKYPNQLLLFTKTVLLTSSFLFSLILNSHHFYVLYIYHKDIDSVIKMNGFEIHSVTNINNYFVHGKYRKKVELTISNYFVASGK